MLIEKQMNPTQNLRRIPFAKINCDGNERKYVLEVLESGWLTTAGKAQLFEKRFAETVDAKFAYAVNSCTAALHLGLEALGVEPDDKVLVPSMTFTSSAEVVRYLGADPVFMDVGYPTCLVEPETLQQAIKLHPDIKVFIPVHFGGQTAPLLINGNRGLLDICRENGIKIMEDAAHAFPAKCEGRMVGGIGDITCFSFYANKTITTGEGGMLTTNDETIARRVRKMRLHGIDRDVWDRFTSSKPSWEYDVVAPGFKYNMPDLAAAIGLAQLERAENLRRDRERCARFYFENISDIECIDLPQVTEKMSDHSWHLFPIILKPDAPVTRNRFIELMSERGIGMSVHYKPLHRMTYYRERYQLKPENFPNAERIWKGNASLPIYPGLLDDELGYICSKVKEILS